MLAGFDAHCGNIGVALGGCCLWVICGCIYQAENIRQRACSEPLSWQTFWLVLLAGPLIRAIQLPGSDKQPNSENVR